jgi:FAS-associated factor 2
MMLVQIGSLNSQQVEGPRSAAELVSILQKVVEEQGAVLVASRVEEEERQTNRRLREEQDAAFQAALQADQVCTNLNLHLR